MPAVYGVTNLAGMTQFLEELGWRGLLQDVTPGLAERLARGPISGYVGFDPTARSLQVGNLVPVMLLAHLQRAGGKPIVLVGGGTGLIGDPSGKSAERPLLDETIIAENAERQRIQLSRFLEFGDAPTDAAMVNNADWLRDLDLVPFMRDVGKHFTVSYMLQKESVKSRLSEGISFTEFSYMLLQAYDFLHLFRTMNCELQLGGSDQWGNITAGVELIRRLERKDAHGASAPLITTLEGKKFGKSETGSVWLDADLTSPYTLYQFWINVDDVEVEQQLKYFTFLSQADIADLMATHHQNPGARAPHKALALDITSRVHGDDVARRVADAQRIMFGDLDPRQAPAETWSTLAAELHASEEHAIRRDDLPMSAFDLVWSQRLQTSKSELRRLFKQGGIQVNRERVAADSSVEPAHVLPGNYIWIRRGKKNDSVVIVRP